MSAPENVAMDTKQALDAAGNAVANAPADLEKAAIAGAEVPGVPEYGGQAGDMSWTKAEERSVLRKVDLAIIPWLTFVYVCSQIDRGNLANANIMNKEATTDPKGHPCPVWDPTSSVPKSQTNTMPDGTIITQCSTMQYELGLVGNNYNTAVSTFFIGYVLAELPSNLLLTRVKPAVQMARICVTWGICAALMGATFNFGSLVACRIFLGLFEGGLAPGIIFYLGFWYRKHERASRWAFIYSGAGIAGAFSGIIAFAVANMNGVGGIAGWRWLFILEGVPTVLAGIASFWLIPNYPTTCKFIKGRDLDIQIARLPPNAPTQATLHFDKTELIACFKNVQVWIFCLSSVTLISVLYAGAYFIPTIIAAMGFASYTAQLLNVGLSVCGAVYMVLITLVSEKIKERGWLMVGTLIPPIIGWATLGAQPLGTPSKANGNTYYGILYLTCIATGAIPLLFTYCVQNIKGVTKAATVSAMVVGTGNIGGAIGGQIYQPTNPYYIGHTVNACLLAIAALCIVVIKAMNKYRPEISVQHDDVTE